MTNPLQVTLNLSLSLDMLLFAIFESNTDRSAPQDSLEDCLAIAAEFIQLYGYEALKLRDLQALDYTPKEAAPHFARLIHHLQKTVPTLFTEKGVTWSVRCGEFTYQGYYIDVKNCEFKFV